MKYQVMLDTFTESDALHRTAPCCSMTTNDIVSYHTAQAADGIMVEMTGFPDMIILGPA